MPIHLSFKTIRRRLKKDNLPFEFEIIAPARLTSKQLLEILGLFKDNDAMLRFICALTRNRHVEITAKGKSVRLGSVEKLIHIYTNEGLYPDMLDEAKQQAIITHFQQCRLNKSQLLYLLKNLKKDDLKDLLFNGHENFNQQDLIVLCNDPKHVLSFHKYTIKFLYHYLNVDCTWGTPKTPYLDMYYYAYRAGHILGLTQNLNMNIGGTSIVLEPEGEFNQVSMNILCEKIREYCEFKPSADFSLVYETMKHSHELLKKHENGYQTNAADILFERYWNNQPVFVVSGWHGHAVGVALYGRFLVYCNRGEFAQPVCCNIYAIRDTKKIDQKFFAHLIDNEKNHQYFINNIKKVVDLQSVVVRLKSKPQKRGNCTFANPISTVEALLMLLKINPDASDEALVKAASADKRRYAYKSFTRFVRKRELDELIRKMFYANNSDLIQFYVLLVKRYIEEHHGKNSGYIKDDQEVLQACELFERCPKQIKSLLKQDQLFIQLMETLNRQREQIYVQRRWKRPEQAPRTLHFYYRSQRHIVEVKKGYIKTIDAEPTPRMFCHNQMIKKLISARQN